MKSKSAMVCAMVAAMAVIAVIAAASASAEPDGTVSVEVIKWPTPVFGVRFAELVKGTPPLDITGPSENGGDMGGGDKASQIYQINTRGQPTTASAFYDVNLPDGGLLGTFRIDMTLGWAGDPNTLYVTCDEQLAPVDCYAFENPFVVNVYPKAAHNT